MTKIFIPSSIWGLLFDEGGGRSSYVGATFRSTVLIRCWGNVFTAPLPSNGPFIRSAIPAFSRHVTMHLFNSTIICNMFNGYSSL
jgi:hypothetical protein